MHKVVAIGTLKSRLQLEKKWKRFGGDLGTRLIICIHVHMHNFVKLMIMHTYGITTPVYFSSCIVHDHCIDLCSEKVV